MPRHPSPTPTENNYFENILVFLFYIGGQDRFHDDTFFTATSSIFPFLLLFSVPIPLQVLITFHQYTF